jgi:exonuclease III
MSGKSGEIVEVMSRRNIEIACIQETKWKGEKAKELGNGYKIIYVGKQTSRNGVGVILNEEWKRKVVQVIRVKDRLIMIQLASNEGVLNIISGYAPQVGCEEEEKEEFRDDLETLVRNI